MSESDLNKSVPQMKCQRDAWHWLRHRWSKWYPYTRRWRERVTVLNARAYGDAPFTNVTVTGNPKRVTMTERRETRSCMDCGKTQDREIAR